MNYLKQIFWSILTCGVFSTQKIPLCGRKKKWGKFLCFRNEKEQKIWSFLSISFFLQKKMLKYWLDSIYFNFCLYLVKNLLIFFQIFTLKNSNFSQRKNIYEIENGGRSQVVRQWIVTPSFAGSNPVVRPNIFPNFLKKKKRWK